MKKYLGVMALGMSLALVGATASWAQVSGGPGGSGGPGNGSAAASSSTNNGGGAMNSSPNAGNGGAMQDTKSKDMSPASPNASTKQEK
jgi:hypothetical protein